VRRLKVKNYLFFLLLVCCFSVNAKTIVFLGDSLTEGYGIAKKQGYVALVEKQLKKNGYVKVKVINASVSGSTSASAVSRLKWFLKAKPDILVLALGANDGLRGVNTKVTFENLEKTILLAKKSKLKVLLLGLRMPPNYGESFTQSFKKIYYDLAKKHKLAFVPKLLKGVAGVKKYNQVDGIHPNEAGHKVLFKNIYPTLRKLL